MEAVCAFRKFIMYAFSASNPPTMPRLSQGPNDFSRPRKIHWGVFFCVEASCASKPPQPGAVARRGPNDFSGLRKDIQKASLLQLQRICGQTGYAARCFFVALRKFIMYAFCPSKPTKPGLLPDRDRMILPGLGKFIAESFSFGKQ